MERLQKVLAQYGIGSRRECEKIILSGKVKVNGALINELGVKVDVNKDIIEVEGKKIIDCRENYRYFLFYKPVNVVTTVKDTHNRKVVLDFFKDVKERIYPVGRLDFATEGLLLLTNDGELAFRMMHPNYKLNKTYIATVTGLPSNKTLDKLRNGIYLEGDGKTLPAKIKLISYDKLSGFTKLEITIHEGKKRQIRRMLQIVGHPVSHLIRIKIADFLTLESLVPGKYRELTPKEQCMLKKKLSLPC